MKKLVVGLCFSFILYTTVIIPALTFDAQSFTVKSPLTQGPVQQVNKYFSTQKITFNDGTILERSIINGPPVPPPGCELERSMVALPEPNQVMGANRLTVPAFRWVFGCSAASAAMIAGYYDRSGFPNMYTGPANGGLMPLTEDASWGRWKDSEPATYPNNPLIASHNGLDGRITRGSIDDYWLSYLNELADPYITRRWTQHTWGDAIGDYMKTSQSAYGNVDGSTTFYSNNSSASPVTCDDMVSSGIHNDDGTYGRKLFYEARGYTVSECYAQKTDNVFSGGFSFAQYKAEIGAGHPVLLNLEGHSVVGVGYADPNTVYIHDTWDSSDHSMTWGGSYAGMPLVSVSIVNLQKPMSDMPEISVSPNPYSFGNVKISDTTVQTFTISSIGTGDVTIVNIAIDGVQASEFSLNDDNCTGQTLAPSEICTLTVAFAPSALGAQSAVLEIFSDQPISPTVQINLSGIGVFEVTPSLFEGTLGTEITYVGAPSGFGNKKGKVLIGGLNQKVESWLNTSVKVILTKVPPAAGVAYDVMITSKEIGSMNIPKSFRVKLPEPVIVPGVNDHGSVEEPITINGNFFGTKKGKVYLEYLGKNKSCKVTDWSMTSITFLVPKKLAQGNYPLNITNKIGGIYGVGFTIDPPSPL